MTEAIFSGQSGTADPDILCPTTGIVCPAKARSVELYTMDIPGNATDGMPDNCLPTLDGPKLRLRLLEINATARLDNCAGPDNSLCPTRDRMDVQPIRRTLVGFARGVVTNIRNRRQ